MQVYVGIGRARHVQQDRHSNETRAENVFQNSAADEDYNIACFKL